MLYFQNWPEAENEEEFTPHPRVSTYSHGYEILYCQVTTMYTLTSCNGLSAIKSATPVTLICLTDEFSCHCRVRTGSCTLYVVQQSVSAAMHDTGWSKITGISTPLYECHKSMTSDQRTTVQISWTAHVNEKYFCRLNLLFLQCVGWVTRRAFGL